MTTVIQTGTPVPMPGNTIPGKKPLRNVAGTRGLAMTELFGGVILIILDSTGLIMGLQYVDFMTSFGPGIWSGLIFIDTGIVGIFATRAPTLNVQRKGLFTAFLVLSIVSSVLAFALAMTSIPAINDYIFRSSLCYDDGYDYYNHYCDVFRRNRDALLALPVISLIVYLVLFVITIITSAFGCCNACGSTTRVVSTQHVIYHTGPYYGEYGPPQSGAVHFRAGPSQYNPASGGQFEQPLQYEMPVVATGKGGESILRDVRFT